MTHESIFAYIRKIAILVRHETKEKFFAFLGSLLIALATWVHNWDDKSLKLLQRLFSFFTNEEDSLKLISELSLWLPVGLYILGGFCLAWVAYRIIFKIANPPPLNIDHKLPNAIKGLLAFTEDDGGLFRELGRDQELNSLNAFVRNDLV